MSLISRIETLYVIMLPNLCECFNTKSPKNMQNKGIPRCALKNGADRNPFQIIPLSNLYTDSAEMRGYRLDENSLPLLSFILSFGIASQHET